MSEKQRRMTLRLEWAELTGGPDYETWLESKLLAAEARLVVKCQHPNVEQCERLWQADTNYRQLQDVSPELAEEYGWGCDTVEHLAAALVASRKIAKDLTAELASLPASVHKRRCWKCGKTNWHADNYSPYVECPACGSSDTRKVNP
jgi:hypothetical protein